MADEQDEGGFGGSGATCHRLVNVACARGHRQREPAAQLRALAEEVGACRACPRLVECASRSSSERKAYEDHDYWARGVPGFGDPAAHLLVVGLAPAAHGANRTGRMFTGDRSGDWLYRALYRAGYANQPDSVSVDDGLEMDGAWITSPVKCAPPENKPTTVERDTCRPFFQREVEALTNLKVIVVLGGFGYQVACQNSAFGLDPRSVTAWRCPSTMAKPCCAVST